MFSYLVTGFECLFGILSALLGLASMKQTQDAVAEVNKPISYLAATPTDADRIVLGTQLPTAWR